jgi:hypothetical protein
VVALEHSYTESSPGEVTSLGGKLIEVRIWLPNQLRHVRTEADAHFAAQAAHIGPGDPPVGLSFQIRQHCLDFCESLHFHHTGENVLLLPDLERRFLHLRDVIAGLRTEHRTVTWIRSELEQLLANIATTDPDRFLTELDRTPHELEAHLHFEEETFIPALDAIPFPPGPPIPAHNGPREKPPDGLSRARACATVWS